MPRKPSPDPTDDPTDRPVHRNEVVLRGRVSAGPERRTMPSGDEMTTFRVVVERPAAARRGRVGVDALDCVAWTGAARRSSNAVAVGDVVEVTGSLRRRFQRADGRATSRVDVEVVRCRRVRRDPARLAPPSGRRPRAAPSDA